MTQKLLQPPLTVLKGLKSVCLKVGSALLVDQETGEPHFERLEALAHDVGSLRARGVKLMIVSSGAVGLGRTVLDLKNKRLSLAQKQACAAAGQPLLMQAWINALTRHKMKCAQILLTREDTENRTRWVNARATIDTLLDLGIIPIVNENDTVATEEIRYGDNDRLAARAAGLMGAEALWLLSDIDGLYSADPRSNPDARHIGVIESIGPEIEAMAGPANQGAGLGTGGMVTKITAARMAGDFGAHTILSSGQIGKPLSALLDGARFSLFYAPTTKTAAYKAWIKGTVAPSGQVIIDEGAVAALKRGKSLLASGIIGLEGGFNTGDTVAILGPDKTEIARGITSYDNNEIERLKGVSSDEIEAILGYFNGANIIHRDNMVMI